jgi:SSS family transporter
VTEIHHLRAFDLTIVAIYLIGITLFGLRFRKRTSTTGAPDRSLRSYFLANNTIPWWAISLSIVSAETSTLTIISIPGVAFAGDFGFLQIVLGYMLGRIVVAALFLPRYFSGNMLTAYQLIDNRFGASLHKVTAGLFLLTRAAAEGVRVFAVSIVVGIAIGTRDVLSIAIISALTLLYTFEGGMAAVIWTDVVQMAIYIGGTLVAIWSLGHHIPGGWSAILPIASAAGKFHMLNFAFNLTTTYTFWAGILGGTFLTMASHGTDQLMVQRMLAARNLRESRLALLSSGVVIFIQFALFLLIGAGLYVFAQQATNPGAPFMTGLHPGMSGIPQPSWIANLAPDRIFPTFIVREMPIGITGLLVAAILAAAMSNLSAALNSLSSTTVVDFYMHLRPNADDRERNLISKSSTILWAIVLFAIAVYSLSVGGKGHVVEIGLSIASVAYGCLLGVFLLGTLTKFATQTGATIGMLCGFLINVALWQFPGKALWTSSIKQFDGTTRPGPFSITIPHIAWTWYVLIGAIATFAIGSLFSLLFRKQSKRTAAIAVTIFIAVILSAASRSCDAQSKDPRIAHAQVTAQPSTLPAPTQISGQATSSPAATSNPTTNNQQPTTNNFTPITTLINTAIAAHKLPGAVVLIGHNNHIVFEQAYGDRKLANEPGLDNQPSPAEPMTEDTIFDMASLSKCLSTAVAIMQLYEAGKITSFDDPVAKYLPEFATSNPTSTPTASTATSASTANGANAPSANAATSASTASTATTPSANGAPPYQRGATPHETTQEENQRAEGPIHNPATFDKSKVTIRMLLTHTSGEPPDVSLKDPWGLAAPNKEEGIHLALTTPLKATPGSTFEYSDINFILLGHLVETLSGQPLDVYTQDHIFKPLGMTETRYHALDHICQHSYVRIGSATMPDMNHAELDLKGADIDKLCAGSLWNIETDFRTAPTAHDNEGTPTTNPDFDHLLRGTVHDPTTRRMGGVAGHAGVFSTAHDISLFAQALLDKLLNNTGPFPVKQSTLMLMVVPEQPGGNQGEILNAQEAEAASIKAGDKPAAPNLAPHYPAIQGQNLRGFGWDIDTAFSKPRGAIFPIGSFGHTGFTGTSLWMDPASNTYVILLANAIHPRGNPPISNLRGQVATATALALGLGTKIPPTPQNSICTLPQNCHPERSAAQPKDPDATATATAAKNLSANAPSNTVMDIPLPAGTNVNCLVKLNTDLVVPNPCSTMTGIDVLESTNFNALQNLHHLALLTNQSGIDAQGHRTIDILNTALTTNNQQLTTLFSPEHGITGALDTTHIANNTDPTTHLPVISLYGTHDSDRRPTHAQLQNLDAVVIDLQDAGVHFWTYEAAVGYFLEAASTEVTQYHHNLEIILLDRPNLVGGVAVQGPISDPGTESYVNYMPLPIRHGLTLGELAKYIVATKHLSTHLTVIPMQHWHRTEYFADTGLPWINPSPNLRSPEAAIVYPALGLIDTTNISIGRGTDHPYSFFGADWLDATAVAAALTARNIPNVTFTPTTEPITDDANHYPFHGQTIPAVRVTLTGRNVDTPELGIEILAVLHRLYPTQFHLEKAMTLLCSRPTLDALQRGDDPRSISSTWTSSLDQFKSATAPYLLYK